MSPILGHRGEREGLRRSCGRRRAGRPGGGREAGQRGETGRPGGEVCPMAGRLRHLGKVYPDLMPGPELSERLAHSLEQTANVTVMNGCEVTDISNAERGFTAIVEGEGTVEISAKAVVLATGSGPHRRRYDTRVRPWALSRCDHLFGTGGDVQGLRPGGVETTQRRQGAQERGLHPMRRLKGGDAWGELLQRYLLPQRHQERHLDTEGAATGAVLRPLHRCPNPWAVTRARTRRPG